MLPDEVFDPENVLTIIDVTDPTNLDKVRVPYQTYMKLLALWRNQHLIIMHLTQHREVDTRKLVDMYVNQRAILESILTYKGEHQ